MIKENEVFIDTSYIVALCSSSDKYHKHATILADKLGTVKTKFITTRAVIVEIGNTLSKERHRKNAIDIITFLEIDPDVNIVPFSDDLYHRAFQLYKKRSDKEWGITDCISFVVMEDYRLTEALTADKHFQQAGFKALLLT